LRKGHDTIEREVLEWNPQEQRKRGRPKQTWSTTRHLEKERAGVKLSSWPEIGSDGDILLMPYVPKGITGYDDEQ
jgi:predicted ArsR family transcriptional regulator